MNVMPVEITLSDGTSRPLTDSELFQLEQPQEMLDEPAPHTELGQQVARLEQYDMHKAARAVKSCGRLGEKWTYACGRSDIRKIIRAHLRFCCLRCDQYVAERMFREHQVYRERLQPGMTLYEVSVRSDETPLSKEVIRAFEETVVGAVRNWLKEYRGWGFKSLTHYENGQMVAKGMIALAQGASLPSNNPSIPLATVVIGKRMANTAFERMLDNILMPTLTEGHGVLRANLMAAFQGGNHLRSIGIFYGLVDKTRKERNLRLSNNPVSGTALDGIALDQPQNKKSVAVPSCPFCGPSCRRLSVSTVVLSTVQYSATLNRNDDPLRNRLFALGRSRCDNELL